MVKPGASWGVGRLVFNFYFRTLLIGEGENFTSEIDIILKIN